MTPFAMVVVTGVAAIFAAAPVSSPISAKATLGDQAFTKPKIALQPLSRTQELENTVKAQRDAIIRLSASVDALETKLKQSETTAKQLLSFPTKSSCKHERFLLPDLGVYATGFSTDGKTWTVLCPDGSTRTVTLD